jgi:hypothetical protein
MNGMCDSAVGCTLRSAVTELVNLGTGGVICFAPAISDVILNAPLIISTVMIELRGEGRVTITATATRHVQVLSGGLRLTSIALSGGRAASAGGAVRVESGAELTVVDSRFEDNVVSSTASVEGGAIAAMGTASVTIERSVFFGNEALYTGFCCARGGAVFMDTAASLSITESTFEDNHANDVGGALYLRGAGLDLHVTRNAFLGNRSDDRGAVMDINCAASGALRFENNTFWANQAPGGSIAYVCGGQTLELVHNSFKDNLGYHFFGDSSAIIQLRGNAIEAGGAALCLSEGAIFTSLGGNTSDVVTDPECPLNHPTDVNGNAQLLGLGAFGGPTLTMPISPSSSAIDAATSGDCPPTDQRGFARPAGPACDSGAFELNAVP